MLLVISPCLVNGQQGHLSMFQNLVNKTWVAEGQWENNGPKFKQEITFSFDLENTLVIVDSKGFINPEQTLYGHRNHGVRQFDASANTMRFWEFDVFGNVTQGTVLSEGKNILYNYTYGGAVLTDMWEYVDDKTYNFKVGTYKDGKWEKMYLNTMFKVKE
ncbi:MAG: hypothetical protein GYB32_02025 [Algicola sp.]|nr:hypothetical protein [Algicola sp.]